MAVEETPLGYKVPDGNDPARNGDNLIAHNAKRSQALLQEQRARISNLEAAAGFEEDPLVLTDVAVANAMSTGEESQAALTAQLDAQLPTLVTTIIADDEVFNAAANAAVTAEIAGRDMVEHTDPGAPNVITSDDVLVALTDSDGKQTFLTARNTDGSPTDFAAALIGSRLNATNTDLGLNQVATDDAIVGFTDSNGFQTWLMARPTDGGPTDHAVTLMKPRLGLGPGGIQASQLAPDVVDAISAATSPAILPEVTGTTPTRSLYVNNMATGTRALITSSDDPHDPIVLGKNILFQTAAGPRVYLAATHETVAALPRAGYISGVGDSLTAGGVWLARVASLTGMTTFNMGVAGQTTTEISIRQGGLKPLLTVTGDTIPASGPVDVTAISPTSTFRLGGATTIPFTFEGTLAGIPGTLTQYSNEVPLRRTFTRTTAGSVTACPPGTPFLGTQGADHRDEVQVIWAGRNNINDLANFERDIDSMVANLSTFHKRFLVLSVTNGTAEPSGSANYVSIMAMNALLSAKFGDRYLDVRRYLIDHGLADAGLTPDAADLTAISEDRIPPQLHSDSIHFTTAGQNAVGNCIAAKLTSKGWS